MSTISTPHHLLDQAKRRLRPTVSNIPGMGVLESWLLNHEWKQLTLAEPPPSSGLKPVVGDPGLPLVGHLIELFRGGPDYVLRLYQNHGPLIYFHGSPAPAVLAIGPDATEAIYTNRNKDFSQRGWELLIGPFFERGLSLLEFDEHRSHRRIMQQEFTRARLSDYVAHVDRVATRVVAEDWVVDDARFLLHSAMKPLGLDIALVVFMGRETGADHKRIAKVHRAFAATTGAGEAILRFSAPPFKWWRGLRGRKVLEEYFAAAVRERRGVDGADMLGSLCHAEDEDGNRFTDTDIVNHMIFLMMAAVDAVTLTVTAMGYRLAAHPEWQERARDESARLGDGLLDIEALDKLETLDLVMNETLRLDTPLPFSLRQTIRDTDLLGHYLPGGVNVMTWPSVNHRLPELWTDPKEFDPDRFIEPRSEHKRHRYAFAPWGGGAHKCIGMGLGQLEVKTVMHRVLRRYRLELPHPDYRARWDYGGLPVPTDGMPIMLRSVRR
jgi:cytochrome P450